MTGTVALQLEVVPYYLKKCRISFKFDISHLMLANASTYDIRIVLLDNVFCFFGAKMMYSGTVFDR